MKWITKIALKNYRAFDDSVPPIEIPSGHHLLIYGENGSGKSSLYGALRDFFVSSELQAVEPSYPFEQNRYTEQSIDAAVLIEVTDTAIPITSSYSFTNSLATTTNRRGELQLGNRVKGFLDYKRMLRIHSLDVPRNKQPNVFEIVLWEMLANHTIPDPYNRGVGVMQIKAAFDELSEALCNNDRRSQTFKQAEVALVQFNTSITMLLTEVFTKANYYLGDVYFKTGIACNPGIVPIAVIQEPFQKKYLRQELYLGIQFGGQHLHDYHFFLNEARLSAIALSIHLAALKFNITTNILKVLYLDDVFIGMDTSNRLPLLDILDKEFIRPSDRSEPTQVIISTYDRQWYNVVQRFYDGHVIGCSKYELYKVNYGGHDRPLLLPYETNFDKAIVYLKSATKPDYPAAANYLRKYSEELVQKFLPPHEVKETESKSTIEEHRLGKYLEIAIDLYTRFHWNSILLTQLKNALPRLLHPLSHYELSAPIYKGELEEIVELLLALKQELEIAKQKIKIVVPPRILNLSFRINLTDTNTYEIELQAPIYALKNDTGADTIVYTKCSHKRTMTVIGNKKNKYNANTEYVDLLTCYNSILANINEIPGQQALFAPINILSDFKIFEQGIVTSVQDKINDIQW